MTIEAPARSRRRLRLPRRGRVGVAAQRPGEVVGTRVRARRRVVERLSSAIRPARFLLQPLWARTSPILAWVTGLGRGVIGGGLVLWALGAVCGWHELSLAGLFLVAVFAISTLLLIGRTALDVDLEVEPRRVVVGDAAAARVTLANAGKSPLLPVTVTMPVGAAEARYVLPVLTPGASHDEIAVIPTSRRGVLPIGPVTTRRGDPFGLARRELEWAERIELFIHPRTVPLEPVGSGLLRDLEGHTTNDVSMSDLAFHTLREYAPGDDRRYIHWRSSAKLSGAHGGTQFMVRQFLDTRRSHIAVVVDSDKDSYRDEDEFELAVSAGASVALRALRDEMDLTIVSGQHATTQPAAYLALDTFCRAELGTTTLHEAAERVTRLAPDASVAVLVTGPVVQFTTLQHTAAEFPVEVNAVVVRVAPRESIGMRMAGGLTILTITSLADLPRILQGGQLQ